MKKKHPHKYKPLQELYFVCDHLFQSKDEPNLCSKELVNSAAAKMTRSRILLHNENNHDSLKPENQPTDGNSLVNDPLNRSHGKDCSEFTKPITNTLEPSLQSQNITHCDGSDELVDVRVCDICGDSGREALLALCTKCNDGAEHIYCMRTKLDNVPQGGWMCEDCTGMREQKQWSRVLVRGSDRALDSCSAELRQTSPRMSSGVQHDSEIKTNHSSKASSLARKRPGPCIEMRSAAKKRTFERGIQSLRFSSCETKTSLTRISSLKFMDKGKIKVPQVSALSDEAVKREFEQARSSDRRSAKSEKRFCKGSLYHSKSNDISKSIMNVNRLCENMLKRSAGKECADRKLEMDYPGKKLFKSLSFASVTSVPPDLSNARSAYISTVKGLNHRSGYAATGIHNVSVNKTKALGLSVSGSLKAQTKVVSKRGKGVPSSDQKAVEVGRNIKVKAPKALAKKGKNCSNRLVVAKSVGDKHIHCQSSYLIRSSTENVNGCPDQKAILLAQKAECDNIINEDGRDLVSSEKVKPLELCSAKAMHTLVPVLTVPSGVSAVPVAECIWKGGFKLEKSGELPNNCTGVQAHLSTCASSKVHELAQKFHPILLLKEVSRLEKWPIQFQKKSPTEQDIALYFFAEDTHSYRRSYNMLLESMIKHDLALEANFDGVQLLIFPSSLLPVTSHRWNSLSFLWGVYKVSKVDDYSSHLPSMNVSTLDLAFCSPVTYASENQCVSPLEARSSSASNRSSNFLHSADTDLPAVPQTSALTKSCNQSYALEVPSMKCSEDRQEHYVQFDMIKSALVSVKEETFSGKALLCDDEAQKGTECGNQDVKFTSRTDTFQFGQSDGENMAPLPVNCIGSGFFSDGSFCRGESLQWLYNSINHKPDLAGQSSFSIDSGPSGSSDGCSKSDEVQGEHSENPICIGALNLDLCLGNSSVAAEQVDLDLVLGFPGKYQPNYRTNKRHNGDENMSLVLSLGMPCSNA